MGIKVETRYSTTYTVSMTDTQTTCDVLAAPTNTKGYLTIRRGYSDQEDVYYGAVAGLQLQSMLRGLSPTALTPTEVLGLKKTHALNTPSSVNTVEGTTLHYIVNNKPNMDDDETITGAWTCSGVFYFSNGLKSLKLLDINGNESLRLTATGSAVNYLELINAATGNNVILKATGSDTNVNLEIQGKGTGVAIVPDKSANKTSAAPTADAQLANKKYVDDQITASASGNASTTQKGVVEEATDAEVGAQTATGGTGARLFVNPGSTTVSSRTANKIPVTQSSGNNTGVIDPELYDPDRLYASKSSVYGETIAVNDLLYLATTGKWMKVTSSPTTWDRPLGIALDSGALNDTGKRILLRGLFSHSSIADVNPSFTYNGSGSYCTVGGDVNYTGGTAFLLNNSTGAEAVLSGSNTVSVRHSGALPPNDIDVYLCTGDATSPYLVLGNSVKVGSIIASTTISRSLISGTYQSISFSFPAGTKIPAGSYVWVVFYTVYNANYYQIEADGNPGFRWYTNTSPNLWQGTQRVPKMTIGVTATSPIGYALRCYDSVAATNGSWNLFKTRYGKVIGTVVSATTSYFDPNLSRKRSGVASTMTAITSGTLSYGNPFQDISLGFRPQCLEASIARSTAAGAATTGHTYSIFMDYSASVINGMAFDTAGNVSPTSGLDTQTTIEYWPMENGVWLYFKIANNSTTYVNNTTIAQTYKAT